MLLQQRTGKFEGIIMSRINCIWILNDYDIFLGNLRKENPMKTPKRSTLWIPLFLAASVILFTNLCFAQKTAKSTSDYSIPAELKPVWTWKNGYSAEESQHNRQ